MKNLHQYSTKIKPVCTKRREHPARKIVHWLILVCISLTVLTTNSVAGLNPDFGTAYAAGELIPADRVVDWTPGVTVGVVGGIPTNRTKCVTTECQALENASATYTTGVTDANALIQSAINSALANTYVQLPAGNLSFTYIDLGASRDNITLRGAGMDTTTLSCHAIGSYCMTVGSGSDYLWSWPPNNNIATAGKNKGSTQLTIPDTSAFAVGQMIVIFSGNDLSVPIISVAGYENVRRQTSRITAKTGNTLSFFPPLYEDYNSVPVKINVAQAQTDFLGMEDFTLDGNLTAPVGIDFDQTYGAWVKNVRLKRINNYPIMIYDSLGCEVRHNNFDPGKPGGSNGAGLLMNGVSGCLIEDNIIRDSFPGMEINVSSGNVFAYNMMNNANGQIGIDTNHGPHSQFNLYEGNITQNAMSDGYFGSNSKDTFYRNWLTGAAIQTDGSFGEVYCLSLKRFTRKFSLVGNIFGTNAIPATGECDGYGQPNIGNGSSIGTAQASVGNYWKDFDPINGTALAGSLTTRTDNQHGIVTLTSGSAEQFGTLALWSPNRSATTWAQILGPVVGNLVPVDSSAFDSSLPPANVALEIWPGAPGFQELDLDVEATTLKKGNYHYFTHSIPAAESLGGATLAPSLFRSSAPSFFGSLSWPPFDSQNPNPAYTLIPAGYRFMNAGQEAPGVDGGSTTTTDTTSPVISSVSPSAITSTGVTITWNTNENSDTQIDYGTSASYGFSTNLNGTLVTSHSQSLTTLIPSTLYHFRIKSTDASGNSALSPDQTFMTSSSGIPVAGDFNLDHIINSLDYSLLNTHWYQTAGISTYDLVTDGLINTLDFSVLKGNWGKVW